MILILFSTIYIVINWKKKKNLLKLMEFWVEAYFFLKFVIYIVNIFTINMKLQFSFKKKENNTDVNIFCK